MLTRRSKRGGAAASKAKAKAKVNLFEQYKDPSSDGDVEIGPEGVERLCSDMGMDPSDRKILLLAWKMGARRMGYFSKREWEQGMASLGLGGDSLEVLPRALAALEAATDADASAYRDFFAFSFRFLLTEPSQRIIDVETAVQMLGIVGRPAEPHLAPFLEFLAQQTEYKTLTNDQWMGFLRFCGEVDEECDNYDEAAAWPLLLDMYVDWVREERE